MNPHFLPKHPVKVWHDTDPNNAVPLWEVNDGILLRDFPSEGLKAGYRCSVVRTPAGYYLALHGTNTVFGGFKGEIKLGMDFKFE